MAASGTKLPIQNVRSPVANGGKADNICSLRDLPVLTQSDIPLECAPGAGQVCLELARPIVRRGASLDPNQTYWQFLEERQETVTAQMITLVGAETGATAT